MKIKIYGILLSFAFSSAPAFAYQVSSCVSFDPTQLMISPDPQNSDFFNIVANQMVVDSPSGTWGTVEDWTYDSAKTKADNLQLAQQFKGLLQDYGINSFCTTLDNEVWYFKEGVLPSGTSPHDGNCIDFVAQNLVVEEGSGGGDDVTVTTSDVRDPVSGTIWEGANAAYKQFLVDHQAARFCTISINDPNFYPSYTGAFMAPFTYFTR
jgi:hypothetical protein